MATSRKYRTRDTRTMRERLEAQLSPEARQKIDRCYSYVCREAQKYASTTEEAERTEIEIGIQRRTLDTLKACGLENGGIAIHQAIMWRTFKRTADEAREKGKKD